MFEIANLSGQKYVDQYAGQSDKPETTTAIVPDVSRPSVVGAAQGAAPIGRPSGRVAPSTNGGGPIARPSGRPSNGERPHVGERQRAESVS